MSDAARRIVFALAGGTAAGALVAAVEAKVAGVGGGPHGPAYGAIYLADVAVLAPCDLQLAAVRDDGGAPPDQPAPRRVHQRRAGAGAAGQCQPGGTLPQPQADAVGREDSSVTAAEMAEKVLNLRIFNDEAGKMNRSLADTRGEVLAVSQFTLYGDARGQRRPSFIDAAPAEQGKALYGEFVKALRGLGVHVATGMFQTHMSVEIVNDGPVTILLDSGKSF